MIRRVLLVALSLGVVASLHHLGAARALASDVVTMRATSQPSESGQQAQDPDSSASADTAPAASPPQSSPRPSPEPQPAPSADPQPPPAPQPSTAPPPSATPTPDPQPPPPPQPPPSFDGLQTDVQNLAGGVNASIGVTLIELGGRQPRTWSYNGDGQFTAASTYKLPALVANAQAIASGRAAGSDQICFQDADYEDGAFGDYYAGACFSRNDLAWRAGHYSDNTAAHMLVRDLGGSPALNSYAAQQGATHSGFFDPNVTTSNDLAALWASEARGGAGGPVAQGWLYPLLTNTAWENGIPAGTPGSQVIHKTGAINAVENDAGLVTNGPRGAYVLVVLTDGAGGDLGAELIAQVASRVWLFEASRPA